MRDLRRLTPTELADLRRFALRQVAWGRSQAEVARQHDIHRVTLARWVRDDRLGNQTSPPGRSPKLTAEHQAKVGDLVARYREPRAYFKTTRSPLLWDAATLARATKAEIGIDLTPATMRQYLVRWGIASANPTTIPRAFVCGFVSGLNGLGDLRRIATATDSRGKIRFMSAKAADDASRQLLLANLRDVLGYGRFNPIVRVAFLEMEPHELSKRLATWTFGHSIDVLPRPDPVD